MVYISGKITGNDNYKEQFNEAERELKKMGYEVFNPARIKEQWSYEDYMKFDIRHLLECEQIYLLPNWQDSKGARLEKEIAEVCGIKTLELKWCK